MSKVKKRLYAINLDLNDKPSSNFNVQVTTFLSQLNEKVGLTVCQMFVIDQTAVLSVSQNYCSEII